MSPPSLRLLASFLSIATTATRNNSIYIWKHKKCFLMFLFVIEVSCCSMPFCGWLCTGLGWGRWDQSNSRVNTMKIVLTKAQSPRVVSADARTGVCTCNKNDWKGKYDNNKEVVNHTQHHWSGRSLFRPKRSPWPGYALTGIFNPSIQKKKKLFKEKDTWRISPPMLLKPACRIESFEIGSISFCPPHIELRDLKVLF